MNKKGRENNISFSDRKLRAKKQLFALSPTSVIGILYSLLNLLSSMTSNKVFEKTKFGYHPEWHPSQITMMISVY